MSTSTIFALSSGVGRAGIAVIRISGPATQNVLTNLIGHVPPPRSAHYAALKSLTDRSVLDRGLALFFPGPASFTGEDVAELHVHGSPAVVRRLLEDLSRHPGLAMAEPGAFTERAFTNGKLDLTEVEGLADLIAADTDMQRQQALAQSSGVLRERSAAWRTTIIHALALIEAVLDFSDEGDVTEGPITDAVELAASLRDEISIALADHARAETIRTGLRVALIGAPNAGKSRLLNALAARDVAIVTPEAGTTRDTIEAQLELAGLPVTVIDTAGLRETTDVIEREGIRRAENAARDADLVLHVIDSTSRDARPSVAPDAWQVLNKTDLVTAPPDHSAGVIYVSAATGDGIDVLLNRLEQWCVTQVSTGEPALITRARQRSCLENCSTALTRFLDGGIADLELRAEDLRAAVTALARLTGDIDAEDVLDDIFAGFCIGK